MTEEEVREANDVLNYIGIENVHDIVFIKKGATVGSILKALCPKIIWGKENVEGNCIFGYINEEDVDRKPANIGVELGLWKAKYKKEESETKIVGDNNSDLMSCPLCGGKAELVTRSVEVANVKYNHTSTEMFDWCKVVCRDCGCSTTRAKNPESARLLWNIRTK